MENKDNEFEKASGGKQAGIVTEFVNFMLASKKFWLLPLVLVLLALTAFVLLSHTAAAPFIYTLF